MTYIHKPFSYWDAPPSPVPEKKSYDDFTPAERDFIKIMDLGYIVRSVDNNAFFIKIEGSRDINFDLYKINITKDFGLKFNKLEVGYRYSIAKLKEMINELS